MKLPAGIALAVKWLVILSLVIGLSSLISQVRPGEGEAEGQGIPLALTSDMTIQQIAKTSGMPRPLLGEALSLQGPEDFNKSLAELGLTPGLAREKIRATRALARESASKNWRMIFAKFTVWIIFLTIVFILLHRRSITPKVRFALLALSVAIFGIIFGPAQSPMGTVKDAIVLYSRSHVVFYPRMIAFTLFLLGVLLANKFICAWGCQFGVLQDLIFRLGRNRLDRKGIIRQVKPPFAVSNGIRITFFTVFVVAALIWTIDLIEPIDPFKIYQPGAIGLTGGIFIVVLLGVSLFVYRPWCHFLCPFGLLGWMAETASLAHILVNYETCIACQQCARACPSTVMEAILKQDRVTPDCFACGVCITTCPTQSIRFGIGKRNRPALDKFPLVDRKVAK